MRILFVHNQYQIRGGEEESTAAEVRLLRQAGHEVETYLETNDRVAELNPVALAARTVWSREAYRRVQERLRDTAFDVVHVQNFFPLLSPSIHYAARDAGVPVVQTLRNYRLLCPNALFFRQGRVCEDCLGKPVPYPGIQHRCYRNSLAASGVSAAMLTLHRALRTWHRTVDLYVTLTHFARDKLIQGGFPAAKIAVKPNFVDPDPGVGDGRGGYALYVGRLSVEKGLNTLLEAWQRLGGMLPLKIVGDGPMRQQVPPALSRAPHLEWLGRRPMAEVLALMGDASFLIFPSEWYETFGRVGIEAFAKGTPVIAANIGAIAEVVDHGRTGLHFRPGDPEELASTVRWALSHPRALAGMRRAAREEFERKYTARQNRERLLALYHRVTR